MPNHVPTIGAPQGTTNPLVILNSHLSEGIGYLASIANSLKQDSAPHVPSIAKTNEPDEWGVFCLGCTARDHAGGGRNYVYPCQAQQWEPMPGPTVVSVPAA